MRYFLLNSEDYRWQWTSFLSAASTSLYVYLYALYYYLVKTNMSGFYQMWYVPLHLFYSASVTNLLYSVFISDICLCFLWDLEFCAVCTITTSLITPIMLITLVIHIMYILITSINHLENRTHSKRREDRGKESGVAYFMTRCHRVHWNVRVCSQDIQERQNRITQLFGTLQHSSLTLLSIFVYCPYLSGTFL